MTMKLIPSLIASAVIALAGAAHAQAPMKLTLGHNAAVGILLLFSFVPAMTIRL